MNKKQIFVGVSVVVGLLLIGWIEKGYPMDPAKRALMQYDYETRAECQRLNSYRDRKAVYVDWKAALVCAETYVRERRNIREQEARIELLKALKKRAGRVQRW